MVPPAALGDLAMDPREPLPFVSGHDLLDDVPAAGIDALVDAVGPGLRVAADRDGADPPPGRRARPPHGGRRRARHAPGRALPLLARRGAGRGRRARGRGVRWRRSRTPRRPTASGDYPNFVEEPSDASGFFDAETWARLREVKALYDPERPVQGQPPVPPAA